MSRPTSRPERTSFTTLILDALDSVEPLRLLIGRLWPTHQAADDLRTTLTNIRTILNQIRHLLLDRRHGGQRVHRDIDKAIRKTTKACIEMDNHLRSAATYFRPGRGNPSGTRQAITWFLVMSLGQSKNRQMLRGMNGSLAKYVRQL